MAESASSSNNNNNQISNQATPAQVSTVTTENPGQAPVINTIPASSPQDVTQENVKNPQQSEQTEEKRQEESELTQLKSQLEQKEKRLQDLEQKYAQDTRKAQIEKLFAPIVGQLYADPKTGLLNEKEYNTEVSRLVKSNHSFDEISELIQARFVLAQYHNAKTTTNNKQEQASFTSHVDESASFPYTKMVTSKSSSFADNKINEHDSIGLAVLRKLQGGVF
jgi:flagellar motor protein MotB